MHVAFVVEPAFAIDRHDRNTVKRKHSSVDGVVVHERIDVTAVLFQHKVSDYGNHVLACRDDVLLAFVRNPFRAVVQLDPALAPVVNQCSLDHVGTVQLRAVRVKQDTVKVVDGVHARHAVLVRAHRHDTKAEPCRVLECLGATAGVGATLKQGVKELVVVRLALVPHERIG